MKYAFLLCLLSTVAVAQLPVIVHETFDKNTYGWHDHQSNKQTTKFSGGKYYVDSPDEGLLIPFAPYIDKTKNFSIQATFRQISGMEDNGIGFVWGYDGKGEKMNSFTFTSNGYWRIWSADSAQHVSGEWHSTHLVKRLGQANILKIEQRSDTLYFYLNGTLIKSHKSFPWFGRYIGFVAYTKMTMLIDDFILSNDIEIRLPAGNNVTERFNLGQMINSEYHEVSPKISADGNILYFARKNSPQNVGGEKDKEDVWLSKKTAKGKWSKAANMGPSFNTPGSNNLLAMSTDNNTFLFHTPKGFGVRHRVTGGWSDIQDLGIRFDNESHYLEGSLTPDGKAIIFTAKLKSNVAYRPNVDERDIYVCEKKDNGAWSAPIHTGRIINSAADEYSPFLAADGKTLYFGTNGRPGFGEVDVFMAKRLSDDWTHWSEPVNLGLGVNTVGFDAYYTVPASGDIGYMVTDVNTVGHSDIISFLIPQSLKPEPVLLISGKVLNAKTGLPLAAEIRFDDLALQKEAGEARSDPATGNYRIALPKGKNYGYHAAAPGYLSINENLELVSLTAYDELKKDLYLVPIEVGESVQLKNVFFVRSKAELKPESYPELDRLVNILKENRTMEIELQGHTDNVGNADDNLMLSKERVDAVKAYLVAKGIGATRITGKGFGGTKPVAPSDTEANRQLNRRVEFKITKK